MSDSERRMTPEEIRRLADQSARRSKARRALPRPTSKGKIVASGTAGLLAVGGAGALTPSASIDTGTPFGAANSPEVRITYNDVDTKDRVQRSSDGNIEVSQPTEGTIKIAVNNPEGFTAATGVQETNAESPSADPLEFSGQTGQQERRSEPAVDPQTGGAVNPDNAETGGTQAP